MCSQVNSEGKFNKRLTYLYCANAAVLAVGLFLHGFFPVKSIKGSFSSVNDLPLHLGNHWLNADEYLKRKVDKLVIMVIDAIRYDFIYGEDGETNMPYTSSSINNNQACLFKLRANAPTVTMPRIKAITSGSVSNFVDILMNFGSFKMLDDNIIDQARHNDYKIVFYGDDTWLKLYPERFDRSEGTSSFFVSDYIEVDNNVTRNINIELEKHDWNIMILHYLGLDHIGHLDGPRSNLVVPKLNEMDDIVKQLDAYLLKKEKDEKKTTLLMVLGDHGMADSGGHGGTSIPEIIVPLVSFGLGCGGVYKEEIAQVDVASTLSILLGIPLPADNIGQVILPLLMFSPSFSTADVLYALYYNAYQVVTQFLQNGGTVLDEGYKEYWQAQLLHMEWLKKFGNEPKSSTSTDSKHFADKVIGNYKRSLHLMSSHLLKSAADFHLTEMIVGLIILAQLFFIALFGVTFELPPSLRLRIVSALLCCVSVLCWWMNLLDTSCCLSSFPSIAITLIVIFVISLNSLLISNCQLSLIFTGIIELKPDNFIGYLLLAGTILQMASLAATSLIEREQMVWYHLCVFVLIITMFYSLSKDYQNMLFESSSLNNFNNLFNSRCVTLFKWSVLLVIHRFLKNYQECQHSYTLFWLSNLKFGSKFYLSCISVIGLFSVWWSVTEISKQLSYKKNGYVTFCEKCLTFGCLLIVYYYRAVTGQLVLPFTVGSSNNRGVTEVKIFFLLFILLLSLKVYNMKQYSSFVNDCEKPKSFPQYLVTSMVEIVLIFWILLCTLLTRPHNIWLSFALVLTCKFFNKQLKDNVVSMTIVYYWIGMLFYFYQGNSNYISSIDITAGYVGQSDYNAVTAGLFIAINAFSFPVMSYLLLLFEITKRDWQSHLMVVYKVRLLMMLMHLFFYLLITTLHRYHLFIWSVFSPKLLYLSVNSIFTVILYWLTEALLLLNNFLSNLSSSYPKI